MTPSEFQTAGPRIPFADPNPRTPPLRLTSPPVPRIRGSFTPTVPKTAEETGLTASMLEQLIVKAVYVRAEMAGHEISTLLGFQFSIIAPFIEMLRRRRILEVKGSSGFGDVSTVFTLSDSGRTRAQEYIEENSYVGAAPVPLSQYNAGVRAQKFQTGWLTKEALAAAYRHMVLSQEMLDSIGPALNSGKSFLLYGKPGNGKTYMAEALAGIEGPPVFVPHAIECNGLIIQVYDPVQHRKLDDSNGPSEPFDARWVRCRMPFIVTGGELTIEALDLAYNPASKIYNAPIQLKANNGIYLIDDFGRQKVTPAEILNRWVIPMERRVDYLTFNTGGKVQVPFEVFLVFSTNLNPNDLGDEAFLRRIEYKLLIKSPDAAEFAEIFRRVCIQRHITCSEYTIARFIGKHYSATRKPFRRCHPRDIISHAYDLMAFERLPMELTEDILDRAFASCFVDVLEP
jgi:energy-coupling factor transporter ATP-binding protein EcfA2